MGNKDKDKDKEQHRKPEAMGEGESAATKEGMPTRPAGTSAVKGKLP